MNGHLSNMLDSEERECEELELALKPFAKLPPFHDCEDDVVVYSNGGATITAADIRRAKMVYAKRQP